MAKLTTVRIGAAAATASVLATASALLIISRREQQPPARAEPDVAARSSRSEIVQADKSPVPEFKSESNAGRSSKFRYLSWRREHCWTAQIIELLVAAALSYFAYTTMLDDKGLGSWWQWIIPVLLLLPVTVKVLEVANGLDQAREGLKMGERLIQARSGERIACCLGFIGWSLFSLTALVASVLFAVRPFGDTTGAFVPVFWALAVLLLGWIYTVFALWMAQRQNTYKLDVRLQASQRAMFWQAAVGFAMITTLFATKQNTPTEHLATVALLLIVAGGCGLFLEPLRLRATHDPDSI